MKKTCNNAEGSQNPEKQPTLAVGKPSNGKSQLNISIGYSHTLNEAANSSNTDLNP